jgi:4-carboxymuconolactone decarboxylase
MTDEKQPTAIQQMLGDFAPKLVDYTDRVLFGEVWPGAELSQRDRSIVTVTALVAGGHTGQLPFHLKRAVENGVTREEIIGIITHMAFYAGWPSAMSAINVAKQILEP